ncbi:hypothetical protein [Streptomyces sp. NPDC002580]|uniref:hypothetical protein n=1 Tax=Streptomyces sp. NPDC002580 TaxID=3364653 RepID=UPI0036AA4387
MPVVAAPGEAVQGAVLNYLHRLALATGHPVLATIHDESIGFVVPLQVQVDGSSRYTGEPVRLAPRAWPEPQPREQPHAQPHPPSHEQSHERESHRPGQPPAAQEHRHAPAEGQTRPPARDFAQPPVRDLGRPPVQEPPHRSDRDTPRPPAQERPGHPVGDAPRAPVRGVPEPPAPAPWPPAQRRPAPPEPPLPPAPAPTGRSTGAEGTPGAPRRDKETHALRAVPEPRPLPGSASTHVLRAVPESAAATVTVPTGEFGPPPLVGPASGAEPASERTPAPTPEPLPLPEPLPVPERRPTPAMEALSLPAPEPEPEPKPAPVRGFDAVAEAVLGQSPEDSTEGRDAAAAFLEEPVARINEAVKTGRIESAAAMAEGVVAEAARSLGQEHPEVLKLRELTAYIAYLAGDALRSFHLSLDLARVRRRHRDGRAAYGNVQSAAAAWRAVRDPLQGLHLGRELIGVWTELTADGGPAADDIEQLESARTRMGRLAERARATTDNPYDRTPRPHGE